jgi:nitrous oxide reductase accessory protein NosL
MHPFRPPEKRYQGQCPVCGMVRPMWARTWITFDPVMDVAQVCSFHCLADWSLKSGREPAAVKLAVYHQPERSVPAKDAFIVMGSAAAGTMSPVSKIVFDDRSNADAFANTCGGEVVDYARALHAAKASVARENDMINASRLKKGTIIEPVDSDSCPVCGMLPIRYPYGKSQIKTKSGQTIHFCSTQCLFAFLGRQALFVQSPVEPLLIWVVDRTSGMWISARSAFYVIGSAKVLGPMGYEALPFGALSAAEEFTVENGGTAVSFGAVTIHKVVPQWNYRQHQ